MADLLLWLTYPKPQPQKPDLNCKLITEISMYKTVCDEQTYSCSLRRLDSYNAFLLKMWFDQV